MLRTSRPALGALVLFLGASVSVEASLRIQARDGTIPPLAVGTSTVYGRLSTNEGRPLARVRVTLRLASMGSSGSSNVWEQTTDAAGKYTFRSLPAGRFTLSAVPEHYQLAEYGQRYVSERGKPIDVSPNQAIEANLVAMRGAAVVGRIFDEAGEPLSDVVVEAFQYRWQSGVKRLVPARAQLYASNDIGEYRISNLPTGEFLIAARYRRSRSRERQDTEQGYALTWYPGSLLASAAQAVRVKPGGTDARGIDFVLQPAQLAQISGTVRTSDSQAATGARIRAIPVHAETLESASFSTVAGTGGTFALQGVSPGDYTLTVEHTAARRTPTQSGRKEYAQQTLRVHGQPVRGLVVDLRPAAQIKGVVHSPSRFPAGHQVRLVPDNALSGTLSARVTDTGRFEFQSGPGRYYFAISGLPADWVVTQVTADGRDITSSGLPIALQRTINVTIALSDHAASVYGTAKSGYQDVMEYTVILMAENTADRTMAGGGVRLARADASGRFLVRGLRAGNYLIAALDYIDPAAAFDPALWSRFESQARRITLTHGESKPVSATLVSGR